MLFTWWSAVASAATETPRDTTTRHLDNGVHDAVHYYDYDDDDDDRFWSRSHQNHNQTIITSTVTIRVTPREDFPLSWSLLTAALCVTIAVAVWQVHRERHVDRRRRRRRGSQGGGGGGGGGGDRDAPDSDRLVESASTAEVTRVVFRRLLLFAMVSRLVCIPVMIWSDPIWCQFVGDTLPEMIFATAWTVLVTFFVQVVGIATGTGTNTTPSIVIQLTAYLVYLGLILLELVNSVASVLLYALLCCIYAALLGTIAYFLPHLLGLLMRNGPFDMLVARLTACTVVCGVLFSCHMVGFARIVVDPPQNVYWWWKYGCLEVLPAGIFLFLIRPSAHHKDRASSAHLHPPPAKGLVRVDSTGSSPQSHSPHLSTRNNHGSDNGGNNSNNNNKNGETTALSKSPPMYGATNV